MPRLPRFDAPDRWFHVMNRGIARRTAFETEKDIRYFLSRIARAVRRGELEVHAFCVMTTHYHLLVRSPSGRLSEAMRRIQNEYVRYFNRTRGRDGPLFRGRFTSRPVLSYVYRSILVGYIDHNPVEARLVAQPWAYRHGSASRFMSGRIPRWLCGDWIMGVVRASPGGRYADVWGQRPSRFQTELVEQRLAGRGLAEDPLDDLVGSAPAQVRQWMVKKALLADGTRPGVTCVPPSTVARTARGLREKGCAWKYVSPAGQRRDAWDIATAGLLRHLAGQAYKQIAERQGVTPSMVTRRLRAHRALCESAAYATRLGRVAALCVGAAFGRGKEKVRNRS